MDDNTLLHADQSPGEWLTYGLNYYEDRHSPLNQINRSTIDSLGLAWSFVLGTKSGLEATPIVSDGVMYFTGTWSRVFAVDARKGEMVWTYDPEVPRDWGERVCCDVVNRGVALYKDMVFVGTLDGRLIALNAQSGEEIWSVVTVDQSKPYSITGAPRVVKGKVIIGNGGAEFGVRGYVTAYDAETGEQAWRFYTVPGNPANGFEHPGLEEAAATWTGEWWTYGGGGTAWDAMAFDPELDLLYIGTGNGTPWNRELRSPGGGDNLYLSSIVALDPDHGSLEWYYQTTPGESWDYTATQHIILADLEIDGVERKVLMQAPKNGFFYVLDRTNGAFISAEPYVYTNWAKEIDASGRPIETEFARYADMNARIAPSVFGGHNWQPMAFNKKTGLVYIPARVDGMVYGQPQTWEFEKDPRVSNVGIGSRPDAETREDTLATRKFGKLIAWDPLKQQEVWSAPQQTGWNAGVLTTDELVFQGNAEGLFSAYDAATGEEVWSFPLETGIIAPPVTYEIDGKQFIAILVGWGGAGGKNKKHTVQLHPGTLYAFSLGDKESMPDFPDTPEKTLIDIAFEASKEQIGRGQALYSQYCWRCHGNFVGGAGIPDLTYSTPAVFDAFQEIVSDGKLLDVGMPKFNDRLSEAEIEDIKFYILSQAQTKMNAQEI